MQGSRDMVGVCLDCGIQQLDNQNHQQRSNEHGPLWDRDRNEPRPDRERHNHTDFLPKGPLMARRCTQSIPTIG